MEQRTGAVEDLAVKNKMGRVRREENVNQKPVNSVRNKIHGLWWREV